MWLPILYARTMQEEEEEEEKKKEEEEEEKKEKGEKENKKGTLDSYGSSFKELKLFKMPT